MPRDGLFARTRSRLREALHCLLGSYHWRRGNLDRAREHFLRALEYDEDSFRAHVHLGRVYLQMQHFSFASEELKRAREIDPHRWATELFPGDPLLWMADHLPERRLRRGLNDEGVDVDDIDDRDDACIVEDLPFGDFLDRGEAERFALLPPIAISEAEDIDWAELGRQLIEEE